MLALFKPDSNGDHTLVTRDESGESHTTRASIVRLPKGMKAENLVDLIEAADKLAALVEHQITYLNIKSQRPNDYGDNDRMVSALAISLQAFNRYQSLR